MNKPLTIGQAYSNEFCALKSKYAAKAFALLEKFKLVRKNLGLIDELYNGQIIRTRMELEMWGDDAFAFFLVALGEYQARQENNPVVLVRYYDEKIEYFETVKNIFEALDIVGSLREECSPHTTFAITSPEGPDQVLMSWEELQQHFGDQQPEVAENTPETPAPAVAAQPVKRKAKARKPTKKEIEQQELAAIPQVFGRHTAQPLAPVLPPENINLYAGRPL